MVTAAWAWAGKTKNLRRNPVHGEEEARLVLTDKFEAQDTTTQETEMAGTIELEEPCVFAHDDAWYLPCPSQISTDLVVHITQSGAYHAKTYACIYYTCIYIYTHMHVYIYTCCNIYIYIY